MPGRYDPDIHRRRSIRLKDYDYAQNGAYFVTICVQERRCLLGEVVDGEVVPSVAGQMVHEVWHGLATRFPQLALDVSCIMPNHLHGILILPGRGESCIRPVRESGGPRQGDHKDRPYRADGTTEGSIGRIVQAFKSLTTHAYTVGVKNHGWPPFPRRLWQRNYYEHVIRNETDLLRVRQYIVDNPQRWDMDAENPLNVDRR